jgi:hypothetical protein
LGEIVLQRTVESGVAAFIWQQGDFSVAGRR